MNWWEWLIVVVVILWLIDRKKTAVNSADPIAAALAPHYATDFQTTVRRNTFFDDPGGDNSFILTQPLPVALPGGFLGGVGGGGAGGGGTGGAGGGGGMLR